MKEEVGNYSRFYATFNKLACPCDREELKRTIVSQYTGGRTESLRGMTQEEYTLCCAGIERIAGNAWRAELRAARSGALHQMQLCGIDTADWTRVNAFCQDARISGKAFGRLNMEELEALTVKLRMIRRKGGLKKRGERKECASPVYIIMNREQLTTNN